MPDAARRSLQEIASCIAGYDPQALPVAQAKEFIDRLVPRVGPPRAPCARARRCSPATSSPASTCRRRTSPWMTSYALPRELVALPTPAQVAGRRRRGRFERGASQSFAYEGRGDAEGSTRVQQEFVRVERPRPRSAARGPARRQPTPCREDLSRGAVALLPAAASARGPWMLPPSASEVAVPAAPAVAFFSTGHELRSVGSRWARCVYDSNSTALGS